MYASSLRLQSFLNNANKLSIWMHSENNKKRKVGKKFYLWGISSNALCASAAGSTSELAGASVVAAPVTRPASFFLLAFVVAEPSAALFFFADVLPFFGRATLGSFEGAAAARDSADAMPPAAVVIRGGMKRPRARPMVGGAPAEARPTLAALGFAAAVATTALLEGSRL